MSFSCASCGKTYFFTSVGTATIVWHFGAAYLFGAMATGVTVACVGVGGVWAV
jgi:hypothetical protein